MVNTFIILSWQDRTSTAYIQYLTYFIQIKLGCGYSHVICVVYRLMFEFINDIFQCCVQVKQYKQKEEEWESQVKVKKLKEVIESYFCVMCLIMSYRGVLA